MPYSKDTNPTHPLYRDFSKTVTKTFINGKQVEGSVTYSHLYFNDHKDIFIYNELTPGFIKTYLSDVCRYLDDDQKKDIQDKLDEFDARAK